jgi:hypothetical protein
VLGSVVAPSAALASGGINSGGVNSGGVNSGGSGAGGTTTVASGPCAHITSFGNSTGYYSVFAAIWTSYSISGTCSGPVSWTMTYTDNTGAVAMYRSGSFTGSGTGGTIDEDWAAFSTPYTVALTVTDSAGHVLDSRSAVVTTPAAKDSSAG